VYAAWRRRRSLFLFLFLLLLLRVFRVFLFRILL
jgi:regulatory protein YycI of two-component signal transduction system YycFG